MTATTTLLPFQPTTMTPAQLAAVSFLARYSGRTHGQYTDSLRRWFTWCDTNGLDPLIGIQRAHVELYVHDLRECEWSWALDNGIDPDDWRGFEDRPVVLAIIKDRLFPVVPKWLETSVLPPGGQHG